MRSMRWLVVAAVVAAAGALTAAALAVAPWPGLARTVIAPGGKVHYVAERGGSSTALKTLRVGDNAVVASSTFDGVYGIPAVTSVGAAGGLSHDGRLLVLVEPPDYRSLRARSSFLVVSTAGLRLRSKLVLQGDFGYDALSPDARTMYLIQRVSASPVRYAVRAYDLRAKRLLPGAIVDKREPDEEMTGYAASRATSTRGTWVYTLYMRPAGEPFVHALNAAKGTAFCIDLPAMGDIWEARLRLANGERRLDVVRRGRTIARVDTRTMRVG
jgi:hypothetical protein